jgi:hypothetical protein
MPLSLDKRHALAHMIAEFANEDEILALARLCVNRSPAEGATLPAIVLPADDPPAEPEVRLNKVPPGFATTRIGQDTAADILRILDGAPATLEHIAKGIKRKPDDAQGLLKLLWERKKLSYDGEHYYV